MIKNEKGRTGTEILFLCQSYFAREIFKNEGKQYKKMEKGAIQKCLIAVCYCVTGFSLNLVLWFLMFQDSPHHLDRF